MRKFSKFAILLVSSLMLLAAISPAFADTNSIWSPTMALLSSTNSSYFSGNWGGYVVTGSPGSVCSVSGSWIVPSVMSVGTAFAAMWTGIDGFSSPTVNSPTVEQIGTIAESSTTFKGGIHSSEAYAAWYEFYPLEAIQIITTATSPSGAPAIVIPGDIICANVKYLGGTSFCLTITDKTEGWTFTTTGSQPGAIASSAEWIIEAPYSSSGLLPLADFCAAYYGHQFTHVDYTCHATINGVTGSIGSFGSNVQTVTMATEISFGGHNFFIPKATPSPLSSDGTSFVMTWNSPGGLEIS